jgi:hypothetical protein
VAYTKTEWLPRLGTNLNKFTKSAESPTSVILTSAPDAVTQPGTPFSVESMNKIEQGIFDAHEALAAMQAADPYGYILAFDFEPTVYELATWRCLPLQGQIVQISLYQRLCDRKYVGDAANATADWWYKTSDPQGQVRDVNGAYMRVLDHQGLFIRGAGQNSKYRMANDAPYNGGAIGAYLSDAIRDITGYFTALGSAIGSFGGSFSVSETEYAGDVATSSGFQNLISFRASRVARTAEETRSASIAAGFYIKY